MLHSSIINHHFPSSPLPQSSIIIHQFPSSPLPQSSIINSPKVSFELSTPLSHLTSRGAE